MTENPSSVSRFATIRPSPRFAPVTTAIFALAIDAGVHAPRRFKGGARALGNNHILAELDVTGVTATIAELADSAGRSHQTLS